MKQDKTLNEREKSDNKKWDTYWKKSDDKNFSWLWRLIINYIPKQGSILDAGCGTGTYLKKIEQINQDIIGVDLNENSIKGLGNLALVSNVEKLPFQSNSFKMVVSLSTLQYVNNIEKVITEFERVLEDNGCLIITIPTAMSISRIERTLSIKLGRYPAPTSIKLFTPKLVKNIFKNTKFKIELLSGYNILCSSFFNRTLLKNNKIKNILFKIERKLPNKILSNNGYHILCIARKIE